ncbi:hypothetical protein FC98_GL000375 [Lentilactobacillus kisonensis DSM 19906 = JCM 15041]|uniref:Uncharacterized protein n=1 Tax=Lentilactobacillus kisonensis DSM 19906 = JCM 15041 TaxID=1423766 RepID=A0A0R1NQ95_9LACO|nr:hypothetical protein FC98_GL000375 [Lentilactobacillus kisonensis DSM 19906 = JCM 15041]
MTIASVVSLILCLGAMAFLAVGKNQIAFAFLIIGLVIMIINMFFSRRINKPR